MPEEGKIFLAGEWPALTGCSFYKAAENCGV